MEIRRTSRLKKDENADVRRALAEISLVTHSLSRATTLDGISVAHEARTRNRDTLRSFETTKKRLKDLHTQRLRTKRAWTKVGAIERARIKDHYMKTLPRKSMS
jgi:hypothetical protein